MGDLLTYPTTLQRSFKQSWRREEDLPDNAILLWTHPGWLAKQARTSAAAPPEPKGHLIPPSALIAIALIEVLDAKRDRRKTRDKVVRRLIRGLHNHLQDDPDAATAYGFAVDMLYAPNRKY
jgi:hypothetical protein